MRSMQYRPAGLLLLFTGTVDTLPPNYGVRRIHLLPRKLSDVLPQSFDARFADFENRIRSAGLVRLGRVT
jgi:hypothetical protein